MLRRRSRVSSAEDILEPEAEKLKAELTLRLQAQQAGGTSLEEARAALAAKPDDLEVEIPARRIARRRGPVFRRAGALPGACRARSERDKSANKPARPWWRSFRSCRRIPSSSRRMQRQLSFVLMD